MKNPLKRTLRGGAVRRAVASAAAVAALAGGAAVIVAQPAEAIGGNCYSRRVELEALGPNSYLVEAWCSSLAADTKARGVLDISGEVDRRTPWFTRLGVSYYSDAYRCIPGQCSNTRVELARR